MTDYVHRGAYPLIVTAILAGLFVLVFLRPRSAMAQARWPRILVTVWVGQNLLLVASTAWRTAEYIHDYLLTRMRIAAFIWMALVALGLALICWRILKAKSAGWLINANALAAGAVLVVCSLIDFGPFVAAWNIAHAKEFGGDGQALDVNYMRENLGGSSIVALTELCGRPMPTELGGQVALAKRDMILRVERQQADWRGWRWRDARRLDRAHELEARQQAGPHCLLPPPPPPQLTPPAQPGT